MIRQAIYAGTWYPVEKKEIERYLDLKAEKSDAICCICPHAGWLYSGKIAGMVYSRIASCESYVLIGPNHTGHGVESSVFNSGSWQMLAGEVEIDETLANNILQNSEFLQPDTKAHINEHSLEVQLPFIQYFNPHAKIVPIILRTGYIEVCKDIGRAIYTAIKGSAKKVLIVASTDMTHYEPHDLAKKKDKLAIDEILALNADGVFGTVQKYGISMCGYVPVTVAIIAARGLSATSCKLIKYATSGDVSGDYDAVVGYAGFIIK